MAMTSMIKELKKKCVKENVLVKVDILLQPWVN